MFNVKIIKRMLNFTTNKKRTFIIGIILMVESMPYLILYPIVLSQIIDNHIPNHNLELVLWLSLLLIVIIIIRLFCDVYSNINRKFCYYDNDRQIKNKLFEVIQNADISELDKIPIGSLFQITTFQSFDASQFFIWYGLALTSVRIPRVILTFIIIFIINWEIASIVMLIFVLSYIILIPFYTNNKKIYEKFQIKIIELQGKMNEYIDSYSTTKTLCLEEINIEEIKNILNNLKNKVNKSNKILELHTAFLSFLTFISVIAVLIIGGYQMAIGVGVGSTIILIIDYINDISDNMNCVIADSHDIINKYYCFLNVLKLSSIKKENDNGTLTLEKIKTIEFKDVKLSYDKTNLILNNINLKIDKPLTIAVVGKSGTGKSSLVNLLPRFYPLTDGQILINGVDYTEYKLDELRKNISYVFQDPVILNMTIKDNLIYGNDATDEELIEMCKKIGLHQKIMSFKDQYDTVISSKSDYFSYGEKQLLSFARAALKKGSLVILDEVTSNLDLKFEENLMGAMKGILKNKIAFVIAHRLNTIKEADLIIYIAEGNIKEMGNHNELMKLKGQYYNLYSKCK